MTLVDTASEAYYAGQPILTDEEFDALEQPEYVGHKISGIPHLYPMWSLQKAYDGDDPLSWYKGTIVKSPKLDGAAVALEYDEGIFYRALTRGNGKEGLDITDKVKTLVPNSIHIDGRIQITGEVVAPKHQKNSRNYAAGALNLKSVEEFQSRELTFIAYGLEGSTDCVSWVGDMHTLHRQGFNTIFEGIDLDQFPQDGVVFRINDKSDFYGVGYTSKHPRGAYAAKERTSGSITKLLSVEWNVGRSGVVAPTAILEPVLVGDAVINKSTLHNIAYINALNLEIGCTVEVIRAGEIIPRIVRRIYD